MFEIRQSIFTCMAVTIGLQASHLRAQTPANVKSKPHVVAYTVQPGENLTSILLGLQLPDHSAQALTRLRKMNPANSITALRPGQTLQIPESWLRQDAVHVRIAQINCTGTLLPELSDGRVLVQDQWLAEGSTVKVPPGCKVVLMLPDNSRLQLPSGAVLRLDVLRDQALHKAPIVQVHLLQGKLALDIYKQRPARSRFEVKTNKAIIGVRGTQFRVGIAPDSEVTAIEVLEGKVQVQGESDPRDQPVEKFEGLVINSAGQSQGLEALPAPPMLGITPQSNAWSFLPVPQAHGYVIENLNHVNATVTDTPAVSRLPSVIAPVKQLSLAQLYRAASLTLSGLQGPSLTYAVCHQIAGCGVSFDLSEAIGQSKRFELHQINGNTVVPILSSLVPVSASNVVAAGLAPGHYRWHIEYAQPYSLPRAAPMVSTQGVFILRGPSHVGAP
jgi:hypothetical protein